MTLEDFLEKVKSGRICIDLSRIVLLHGSPPCQGFSRVNTSGGINDATNAQCTLDFLEVAKFVQPPFVSMENVPGLLDDALVHGTSNTKSSYLKTLLSELISMSYSVRVCKVVASDFGDPTKRERVILLAAKKGWKLPSCPKPTHGSGHGLAPVVTCSDILKELETVNPVSNDGFVTLQDGREVWGHFIEKTMLTENSEGYESLKANEPAITIRKKNPVKHYSLDRYITILERSRLMSFPYGYEFEGSHQDCMDQIGNAVPVRLASAIGRSVMESYRLGRHETLSNNSSAN
jgi:DNA (cytosine-5)-methyltransferase 1